MGPARDSHVDLQYLDSGDSGITPEVLWSHLRHIQNIPSKHLLKPHVWLCHFERPVARFPFKPKLQCEDLSAQADIGISVSDL